jgi:hypothetical protein
MLLMEWRDDDDTFPNPSDELLIKLTQIKAAVQNPGGEF